MNWIFTGLRRLDVEELMEVTLGSSGDSVEPVFGSSDGKSWHIIIDFSKSSFIVVGSDSSEKSTTHKNKTIEFIWVALNVSLRENSTK